MWKELEWRKTYNTAGRILKAEKDLFTKVEGGEELYKMLVEMFKAKGERITDSASQLIFSWAWKSSLSRIELEV